MRSRFLLTGAALLASVACAGEKAGETDPKLAQLTVGMSRDSLLMILGYGSPVMGDSLANIYRREAYLFNGAPMEILFYSPTGQKEGQGSALPESTLRPVILDYGKVTGWGWTYFDSVARVHDIRARVR